MKNNFPLVICPQRVEINGNEFYPPKGYPLLGNVKVTYLLENEVVQISPIARSVLPEVVFCLLNRWITSFENQLFLSKKLIKIFKDKANEINACPKHEYVIEIPSIIDNQCGIFSDEELQFHFLSLDKAKQTIDNGSLKLPDDINQFRDLFIILCKVHNEKTGFSERLVSYYESKIKNIINNLNVIRDEGKIDHVYIYLLAKMGIYFLNILENIIREDEFLCSVHGDFRIANILVDRNNKKMALVDFEQGLNDGDWLVDLWKIGAFSLTGIPFGREIFPEFHVSTLVDYYFETRFGLTDPSKYLSWEKLLKRIELIRYDCFVSTFFLRYYMGWFFDQLELSDGRKFRGVYFILRLIQQLAKRIDVI